MSSTLADEYHRISRIPPLAPEQITGLLVDLRTHARRHYPIFATMASASLSLAESLGLQVQDIYIEDRLIIVRRGWHHNCQLSPATVKSWKQVPEYPRTALVADDLAAVLREHLRTWVLRLPHWDPDAFRDLQNKNPECWINRTSRTRSCPTGKPWGYSHLVGSVFHQACRRLGLPPLHPKQLWYALIKARVCSLTLTLEVPHDPAE